MSYKKRETEVKRYSKVFFLMIAGALIAGDIYQKTKHKKSIAALEGGHVPYGPYEAVFKRPLDVLVSSLALLLLAPILGALALAVKVRLGSPVIFSQERPGLNGKVFRIRKFRTMTDERDGEGALLSDEIRLTGFGKLLRSTSLDELPELWNILRGEMSIVGPRPLLVEYLERYNDRQKHRHDVRPGLTGLAQVSGRNDLSWNEKFEDDLKYVEHITFLGDVRIILDTIRVVFRRDGIHSHTSATMEAFTGMVHDRDDGVKTDVE